MKFNKYNSKKTAEQVQRSSVVSVVNDAVIGSGVDSSSSGKAGKLAETHTIYGNPFDGTQDIKGVVGQVTEINAETSEDENKTYEDITINADNLHTSNDVDVGGDITIKSNATVKGSIKASSAEINGDINVKSNATVDGNIKSSSIETTDIVSTNGTITNLSGEQLNYLKGIIKELSGTKLTYDNATLKDLTSNNISVETLTVTKAAHFFSLVIDEIKSVGGQIILTPANATLNKTITVNGGFKCYWKATDGEKKIYNQFEVNDQIVCQTFNASVGTSNNVSNTFYWRLCTAIGTETMDGVLYNYVVLSDSDKDKASTANPSVGDKIVQLGNRNDPTRQNAIILSAYNSKFLDAALKAPSIVQYKGINDYKLETHRGNVISAEFNSFIGDFKVSDGQTIEDFIKDNAYQGENNIDVRVFSLDGNLTLVNDREVDLYAEVWCGLKNITDNIPPSLFSWVRTSSNTDADASWNKTKEGIGKTIHLKDEDVVRRCTFDCIIDIDSIKNYL
ncbi:hypothetical protein Prede_1342 [Prevotella dentalis DSM 3688]|uniref:Uncharacterized protein n=1 Tax=Prevotella dentalis (strain ATCC 49559 / DSM 3688 / JCM 13448 / NCTC 12043 / ES 2772) TaxID=908937 RepID=F9D2Y9_PREDD|nr:polymer-forming cytoskeletal protein [Prevotella dentalis]AGB28663.1 hypothetical protein Prede_1342 [Prevotella dentalis DSM 3688]EGQ15456.1 hypothetical protein HMPREF9136_1217 [Prevotella dentalis DSM 3688]